MFGKAAFSAGSGAPIAMVLNFTVLPLFTVMIVENNLLAALLIGIIYSSVSILRLFIIDLVEDRYGLNIRPDYLLCRLFRR